LRLGGENLEPPIVNVRGCASTRKAVTKSCCMGERRRSLRRSYEEVANKNLGWKYDYASQLCLCAF
jgi:hypothetical protein